MSIETMTKLATTTLNANTASVTFSNIPQTYTDLTVIVSSRDDRSGQPNDDIALRVGFGGTVSTSSIYSNRRIYGSGASAGSGSASGTFMYIGHQTGATATASTFGITKIYIPNYTSSNLKSVSAEGVSENNSSTAWAILTAGLISDTRPISDINLFPADASNFMTHSTFTLYGVKAARTAVGNSIKAVGGNISFDGTYVVHTFNTSGTFTPSDSLRVDYLVVAGGGGGAGNQGGGGGAGGLRSTVTATGGGGSLEPALSLTAGTAYTVAVGAGGVGTWGSTTNGSNSVFSTITSTGGGKGGSGGVNGSSGGSGGGGGYAGSPPVGTGGAGTANQGYAGGDGVLNQYGGSGGGAGGAGSAGNNASINGGAGVATSISGTSVTYAAGGNNNGSGNGATNTGNGAQANQNNGANSGGSGGSGVVIIRYRAIA